MRGILWSCCTITSVKIALKYRQISLNDHSFKPPLLLTNHFLKNRFVPQWNTVLKFSRKNDHSSIFKATANTFGLVIRGRRSHCMIFTSCRLEIHKPETIKHRRGHKTSWRKKGIQYKNKYTVFHIWRHCNFKWFYNWNTFRTADKQVSETKKGTSK